MSFTKLWWVSLWQNQLTKVVVWQFEVGDPDAQLGPIGCPGDGQRTSQGQKCWRRPVVGWSFPAIWSAVSHEVALNDWNDQVRGMGMTGLDLDDPKHPLASSKHWFQEVWAHSIDSQHKCIWQARSVIPMIPKVKNQWTLHGPWHQTANKSRGQLQMSQTLQTVNVLTVKLLLLERVRKLGEHLTYRRIAKLCKFVGPPTVLHSWFPYGNF